ncbi:MAG: SSU ribosomal protein S4p (S9e) @ SSU ribosomal protein S4p (S9e), zinc-independent, partial [uncultured Sphingomonas sp.]
VEAHQRQVQARPPHGRERLRASEEPGQPPRVRPRPARPAPQEQDVRLRHPAACQAKAQGLLRRRHRKAVQEDLLRGQPDEGRRFAEPDRPARAAARHDRLPRQVCAHDLGRAPAGQPRPRPRQRRQVQHRLAPGERRRSDRARPQGAGDGAGDGSAEPRRARHPRVCRCRRHRKGHLQPRPHAGRGALPRADGTKPGCRVLQPI